MKFQTLLSGAERLRAKGLLPMLYKPTELAQELGIHVQTIYKRLIPAGAPVVRDGRNHIWINGTEFQDWVLTLTPKKTPAKMSKGQGYCFGCRHAVHLINAHTVITRGRTQLTGQCPDCGTTIFRMVPHGQS